VDRKKKKVETLCGVRGNDQQRPESFRLPHHPIGTLTRPHPGPPFPSYNSDKLSCHVLCSDRVARLGSCGMTHGDPRGNSESTCFEAEMAGLSYRLWGCYGGGWVGLSVWTLEGSRTFKENVAKTALGETPKRRAESRC
jgi:hypothetical protein